MSARSAVGALSLLLVTSAPGRADPITFTFNGNFNEGASNAAVRTSLDTAWAGTTVEGALWLKAYTGDGHAVGPVSDCVVSPLTLGTTDGGVWHDGLDGFIVNDSSGKFTITLPQKVYAVSFDFQIFPDGSGRPPDITFKADGAEMFHLLGRKPGSTADPAGLVPGVTLVETFPHSPDSGLSRVESVAQLLGSYTGLFPNGVTRLEFIDWPQRVGIDNLVVDPVAPAAVPNPEPATAFVFGAALVGLGVAARRRPRRAG